MTRTRNNLGDHRMRVLEDAERIGSLKTEVASLEEENARLKETISKAIETLSNNNSNPAPL